MTLKGVSKTVEDMSTGEEGMIYEVGRCHKGILLGRYIDRKRDRERREVERRMVSRGDLEVAYAGSR
jgi:hypothetical protein